MNLKIYRIYVFIIGFIIVSSMTCLFINETMLPIKEGNNAETAYEYHIEKTNCTGYNCGPSCSLQARMWIDEYRDDHNLTCDEFCCAVWFNDQSDWFYY